MPEVAPALAEILFLALVFFTIALAFAARKLTEALFGWLISALESVPFIGGSLAGPFKSCEQAVTGACGAIVAKCEALVGSSFHVMARMWDWLWKQTVAAATADLHIARMIGNTVYSVSGLRAMVKSLEHTYHGIEHGVKSLERKYRGLEHRVKRLEHNVGAGIGNDLRTSVDGLEKTVGKLTSDTIPAVSGEAAKAEHDVTALGEYVKDHYVANTTEGVVAAVAAGIAALGLGGLRCESNPIKNNRNACNWWGDAADLVGLAIALEVALNFETFVHDCQALVETTAEAVEAVAGLV